MLSLAAAAEAKVFVYDRLGGQIAQAADVAAAPVILQQPADALLQPGRAARFSILASGPGVLAYQWRHNGANIAGATNDTLVISGLATTLPDYGKYVAVVSNAQGSTTSREVTVLVDADATGLPDQWEQRYLTNPDPAKPRWTASDDRDGDGISNYDEYVNGTAPDVADFYLPATVSRYPSKVVPLPVSRVMAGQPFTLQLAALGERNVFTAASLPAGLSLGPSTGLFTAAGIPAGRHVLRVTASGGNAGTTSADVTIDAMEVSTLAANGLLLDTPADVAGVVGVAAGDGFNLALDANGMARTWATNQAGGSAVATPLNAVSVAAGDNFALALRSDMTVFGWSLAGSAPAASPPPGLSNVIAVAAGSQHALALRSDGTVAGWGSLGVASAWSVPAGLSNVTAVAAGTAHSAALKADGTVVVWGDGIFGTLQPPSNLGRATAIAAGSGYTGALLPDGTVRAWGNNTNLLAQVPADTSQTVALAGGENHLVVLKKSGQVEVWGAGWPKTGPSNIAAIAAGKKHSFVLSSFGAQQSPTVLAPPFALAAAGQPVRLPIGAKGLPVGTIAVGLPTGMAVDAAAGVIGGTPADTGTFNAVLGASNSFGVGQKTMTFFVVPPVPDFRPLTPSALAFRSGGSAAWTMQGSVVPPGQTTAARSGTPTASSPSWIETELNGPGFLSYLRKNEGAVSDRLRCVVGNTPVEEKTGAAAWEEITVEIPSGAQRVRWEFSSTANPVSPSSTAFLSRVAFSTTALPGAPVITSAADATGTVGSVFSYTITANNAPTSFGATGLPSGLSVNTGTGVISGTPTVATNASVTISASNAAGTGTKTLNLTINAAPAAAPVVTNSTSATGQVGSAFNYTITAANSPTAFGASNLPAGLSVDTATGVISGTPSAAGNWLVTLIASNAAGTGTGALNLNVAPAYIPPPPQPAPSLKKGKAKPKPKPKPKPKAKGKPKKR